MLKWRSEYKALWLIRRYWETKSVLKLGLRSTMTHLLKVLQRTIWINTGWVSTAVTGTPWLTGASLNYVCITCDGCKIVCWLNFDTDCPRWQLPSSGKMPPIYDGSSWAYAWLGREQFGREIIGRFSPLIKWSADQDNLVLSAMPSLHFRRGEFCRKIIWSSEGFHRWSSDQQWSADQMISQPR